MNKDLVSERIYHYLKTS